MVHASAANVMVRVSVARPLLQHEGDDTTKKSDTHFNPPTQHVNPLYNTDQSPLYGSEPSNITTEFVYDPLTNQYMHVRKLGDNVLGTPYPLSFDEYKKFNFERAMNDYWRQRSKTDVSESRDVLIPKLHVGGEIFDRIFGGNNIDIKPQGSAELRFGLQIDKTKNPTLPIRQQRTTIFDFNEKIQLNVVGQIGEKMKINVKYDTEATFDFENSVKLEYTGNEDEIIQKIEAGNVSLPLTGTLITGSRSLFGFKTELKFGKLTLTSIFSQQKGETSTIEVEGGVQAKDFELKADKYEENKHYFLSHYFKENYDRALSAMPVIISGVNITRIEVWVTNKSGNYTEARNIVAFSDLGEGNDNNIQSDYVRNANGITRTDYPFDSINILPSIIDADVRDINAVSNALLTYGMTGGVDYEKIESARLLSPSEYTLNAQLGYISLNTTLSSDQVLAVAYEYTVGGEVFRVGDFSNSAITAPQCLVVKLLKGTSVTPQLKNWDLMMKNIYNIGAYQLSRDDFILDVVYNNDKTGTEINFLPVGAIDSTPLITVLNLDNLNSQSDPFPDGRFDYVESVTVNSSNGRIIFPVREPFGSYLKKKITNGDHSLDQLADEYVFQELYDSTQSTAERLAEKNKFRLKGRYKSAGGSDIALNAINIPEGSVSVTAGAVKLVENVDYTVDYNLGRIKIINEGILESGTKIKINVESKSMFNMQTKTLLGAHANYEFSKDFNIGATILNFTEKPLTEKVSIGDEPVSNTIWGVNASYRHNVPFLTKAIDFLPLLATKEMSTITATGEFAQLIPGHSNAIRNNAYIDDFEGSKTSIDVKSAYAWSLSSLPADSSMFPETSFVNDLRYGRNRAKLAWYNVDAFFFESQSPVNVDARSSHYVRQVYEQELFPNRESTTSLPTNMAVLNVAYYPDERGPYNFDYENITADGLLANPTRRWGGMTRSLHTTDFEEANIEYIEFWLMDPFVEDSTNDGGDLYFNLGDISEDVLKDGRKSFEHGLPTPNIDNPTDTTVWGRIPLMQSMTNAFDSDPAGRAAQDVGLDGLADDDERSFFGESGPQNILNNVATNFGSESKAYQNLYNDPSSDNFHHFRGDDYDSQQLNILERYKNYNGVDGNSPPAKDFANSAQSTPNVEDINNDNTLNESNNYFQYRVSIRPADLVVGENYITDKITATATFDNESSSSVAWYQFKIPISEFDKRIGNISDFKSIRFMRMFLTAFSKPTVLRFATIDLVRGEWRKYTESFMQPGEYLTDELSETPFDVNAVNIEENSEKTPVNYVLPPQVNRQTDPSNPQLRMLNEQAMTLKVLDLQDGDARSVYKTVGLDVRKYLRLKMFVHAESVLGEAPIADNDISLFIRLGTDYKNNYYEYEIPLRVTPAGRYNGDASEEAPDRYSVWPEENDLDLAFELLQEVKRERNAKMRAGDANAGLTRLYSKPDGDRRVSIMGNPNLSNVETVMIGIRNPKKTSNTDSDDGMAKSAEVWVNELRLTEFDEKGGWAANARLTAKLADFGSVTVAGSTSKPGFGSIEQKVSERQKEEINRFDISSNFELGKFFPEKFNVRIPLYIGYSQNTENPQYNPLDPDIFLSTTLDDPNLPKEYKDSVKRISQKYAMNKSINLTNVKVNKTKGKPHIYDFTNWSASYGYTESLMRDANTVFNTHKVHTGALFYNYNATPKVVEPFKNAKIFKGKAWRIIKDFNFYYLPSQLSFRTNINRTYGETQLRNVYDPALALPISVQKDFNWIRQYDLKYNFSKNLKFDFNATNNARIDEPEGRLYEDDPLYKQKRDTIWDNFKHFGRNTHYHHQWNATYNLPINKIPILNWVTANARYSGSYDWTSGPITADTLKLGNTLQNGNTMSVSTQFNLYSLYNKVKYLNEVNKKYRGRQAPRRAKKELETVTHELHVKKLKKDKTKIYTHRLKTEDVTIEAKTAAGVVVAGETKIIDANKASFKPSQDAEDVTIVITGKREKKENIAKQIFDRTLVLLMSVKNISIQLSETNGTLLPGYMPTTNLLGMSKYVADADMFGETPAIITPTFPFVVGWQQDNFGEWATQNNLVTRDTNNIQPFVQSHNRNWNIRASLEPVRHLKVDITMSHSFSKNQSRYYRYGYDPAAAATQFMELNPAQTGSFSMSTVAWATAFEPVKKGEYSSKTFDKFKDYRIVIADRLAHRRSDYNGAVDSAGFPSGYGRTAQDVLISAFFAAYTGSDPEKVDLNIFQPVFRALPNWRITYDGLSKIPALKKIFRTVNLNHVYRCTYNIGTYRTRLADEFMAGEDGFNSIRNALSDYYSQYEINSVSITEQFSPLIALDVTMVNSFIAKIEIKKSRNLNFSLTNNQLTEMKTNDYVIGTGYRFKDVQINIKTRGRQRNFKSDLNLQLDFSIKNTTAIIRKLEENINQPTSGQITYTIGFSADYVLSSRFNLRLFYDHIINKPIVELTYPRSSISFGLSIRFTLSS